MNFSVKKKIAAAAAAATILGGAGIAFGYWTSTGTGAGSATAGDASAWEVSTDAAAQPDGPLTPGGPASTVGFQVTNNSTGHQGLNQVVISVGDRDPGTGAKVTWTSGACDADDFSVGGSAAGADHTITYSEGTPPVALDLAPGAANDDSVTIAMVNKAGAVQDDCKNVTVPLYLAAS